METRTINLTLDKAREFYNSGNTALREVALQAFTEDEITSEDFKKFRSWNDVKDAIPIEEFDILRGRAGRLTRGQAALLKLNHIRKTLNKGQKMELDKGSIHYPQIRFTTKANKCYKEELKSGYMVKVGTIELSCGDLYDVLGGGASYGREAGLGHFYSYESVGLASAYGGFLGCASQEIAEHMSRHFAREIFDAMYGDFVDYKWV